MSLELADVWTSHGAAGIEDFPCSQRQGREVVVGVWLQQDREIGIGARVERIVDRVEQEPVDAPRRNVGIVIADAGAERLEDVGHFQGWGFPLVGNVRLVSDPKKEDRAAPD